MVISTHTKRLRDVVEEEYVRRNTTNEGVGEIISDPELVHAARASMESTFDYSAELRLRTPRW